MKTKKDKKHYPTDIPLENNVRLLKSGAWGYIYEGVAIFRSVDVLKVNEFSKLVLKLKKRLNEWIIDSKTKGKMLTEEVLRLGNERQKLEGEPKILPNCHLCDAATWRVEGHYYESVCRQKY